MEYNIDDYERAVSAIIGHFGSFSVAYSGGTDSNMLAAMYDRKVRQLLTVGSKEPYADLQRKSEIIAGRKRAERYGKDFPEIGLDFTKIETMNQQYDYFVKNSPFSVFFVNWCFNLANSLEADVILSGQGADSMIDWGLHQIKLFHSGSHSSKVTNDLINLVRPESLRSTKRKILKLVRKYLARYAMINSFNSIRYKKIINYKLNCGMEYNSLKGTPYKMFTLHHYINFCTNGENLGWIIAAQYYSKKAILPFIEPLALHVNSHFRRRHYMDMKYPFRQRYAEFDPTLIKLTIDNPANYQRWFNSNFFNQSEDEDIIRELQKIWEKLGLNAYNRHNNNWRQRMSEMHLSRLFKYLSEQLGDKFIRSML